MFLKIGYYYEINIFYEFLINYYKLQTLVFVIQNTSYFKITAIIKKA